MSSGQVKVRSTRRPGEEGIINIGQVRGYTDVQKGHIWILHADEYYPGTFTKSAWISNPKVDVRTEPNRTEQNNGNPAQNRKKKKKLGSSG